MYGYIYKTTNLVNGKIYIGQHKSESFDEDYKGSGCLLWNAIRKYGWDNFKTEILVECNSIEEMNFEEIRLISEFNARDRSIGYNITEGGSGFLGVDCAHFGESNGMYGKKHSEESRRKMSESQKRREPPTEETRRKLSESHRRENLSESTLKKLSESSKRENRSEETMRKMSESHKRENLSEESLRHLSEANVGRKWIHKGTENKFVTSEDFEKYINEGRLIKYRDEINEGWIEGMAYRPRPNQSKSVAGRTWITNGVIDKFVPKSDLQNYFDKGFYIGRIYKKGGYKNDSN